MSSLRRGSIVWVQMVDPQGRNPKRRPAVVLTPTAEIAPGGAILVAAITSQIGVSPPTETVTLPWQAGGHPRTKLDQPSEVVCSWVVEVPVSVAGAPFGFVPDRLLSEVLLKVPPPPA